MRHNMTKKTQIIAIEGIDGSGKSMQFALLRDALVARGFTVATRDFPDYGSFFGGEVGRLLSGNEAVRADNVDGKSMALWYALDRWESLKDYCDGESDFLIFNRFVLSNAVYQSIRDIDLNKPDIVDWVLRLEYEHFKLPRPDINIFFDVEPKRAQANVKQKGFREYMGDEGQHDVYEASDSIQTRARAKYLEIAQRYKDIAVVPCMAQGQLLSPEAIAKQTMQELIARGILAN